MFGFAMSLHVLAVLLGSLKPFLTVLPFPVLVDGVFVREEEKRLNILFGNEWSDHRRRVRRWIQAAGRFLLGGAALPGVFGNP